MSLLKIQQELKVHKGQYNDYGKYNYRSCEDILEALKPFLKKYDAILTITDDVLEAGGRVYIKATVRLTIEDQQYTTTSFARDPEIQKGMAASQITGTASSYARKYALNGLFLIDDTKDADTMDNRNAHKETQERTDPVVAQLKKALEYYKTDYSKTKYIRYLLDTPSDKAGIKKVLDAYEVDLTAKVFEGEKVLTKELEEK